MKLRSWGAAALAACALLASVSRLHANQGGVGVGGGISAGAGASMGRSDMGSDLRDMEQSELAGYNNCNTCQPSCCDCTGPAGLKGLLSRPIQIVAGAEYIYARANFSDALAFVEQDLVNIGETWHCYDFNYNSSYGFYGGVYLPECGGSMLFNFRRLTSDADVSADSTSTTNVFGPFEVDDHITGHASVDLKSYDLSFAKTIPLGCPLECGCKKGCGDSCDDTCCDDKCCSSKGCGGCGCWCPAWDITWSGGVRFADVGWNSGLASVSDTGVPLDSFNANLNFQGFGGRVGLMGRRYIGKRGLASLYARGDWSLLVGDVEQQVLVTNAAGTAFINRDCTQIIPVTEIELGASAHLGAHATLSAGYFWSAWHDLGMSQTYDFNQFQLHHWDDANILGFDGLFARVEVAF